MFRDKRIAMTMMGLLIAGALVAVASAQEAAPGAAPAESESIPTKSLLQIFHDGGVLMYPIALCSIVLMVFVFERFIALRRSRVIPGPFVKKFLEQLEEGQLDRDSALKLCEENQSPVSFVLTAAVKKWGRTAVEVEQAIIDSGERVSGDLRKHLRIMNGITQVSPLLGLLGTVMGMISSFNAIAGSQASGQRERMAEGIAEALITTAGGMFVAIPALLAYLYFVGRVDRLVSELDSIGQRVVDVISADAVEREAASRGSRKKAA